MCVMTFPLATLLLILALMATSMMVAAQEPGHGDSLYRMADVQTRWVSPENPTGEKGGGGKTNHGAKGNAFISVKPGATLVLADLKGAGIIHRMWLSGTIPRSHEQCRSVKLEMFWDGATKPAVDCPIGDFFGAGLGVVKPFESALFSNPEGRSFNFTIPMPYRHGAKIQIVNESDTYVLIWYDINLSVVKSLPSDALYFHAAWHRDAHTKLGVDFQILPHIVGRGRYLGTHVGVIGSPEYMGTWFGEGEVKVFLDGDKQHPTLIGTGTEDYIGSGWGQGVYHAKYFGSLVSDSEHDLYSFYRYHLDDPVYFHKDCRVTLQQIGNTSSEHVREMLAKGVEVQPVGVLDAHDEDVLNIRSHEPTFYRLFDEKNLPAFSDPKHPNGGTNFYRRDDVSATVYFYLDRPESNLPPLASKLDRMQEMNLKVWSKLKQ